MTDLGWSWCWRFKSQTCCIQKAVFLATNHGSLPVAFFCRVWGNFSHSTITRLEKHWSASSLSMSLCSSFLAWLATAQWHVGLFLLRKLVLMVEKLYLSWFEDEKSVVTVANQTEGEKSWSWEVVSKLMRGWKKGCSSGKSNRGRKKLRLRYVRF